MKELLKKVVYLSIKAGNSILNHYDSDEYEVKEDKSPLTKADIESNEVIKKGLNSFSAHNILSEEGSKTSWDIRKNWSSFWIVDPLDGTKEFLKKNGEFTVNIALIENNIPKLGVVYAPALQTLYYGLDKNGSFKHKLDSKLNNINFFNNSNKIKCKTNIENLKVVASRSHPSKELDDWLSNFNNYELIDAGSSLKFCLIAEGVADVYPRFVGSSEWDIAAGYVVLKEAGGKIIDSNLKKINFNKESIRNPHFIASSDIFYNKKIIS